MRKLLIGPVLTGVGYAAGSYYGASAEQVVHKTPDETYVGVSHALDNIPERGTTQLEGGKTVPYELRVERQLDHQLIVHVLFDGREGGRTEIDFAPQNDGKETIVTAKAHGERAVLSDALAGTSKARLAYAPDWMLNLLAVRPLLQQLAQQIESGQQAEIPGMGAADWESSLPPDQQHEVQEYRQYEASRPTVDPDADAKRYMSGNETSSDQGAN
jgi:hypothetical protein